MLIVGVNELLVSLFCYFCPSIINALLRSMCNAIFALSPFGWCCSVVVVMTVFFFTDTSLIMIQSFLIMENITWSIMSKAKIVHNGSKSDVISQPNCTAVSVCGLSDGQWR